MDIKQLADIFYSNPGCRTDRIDFEGLYKIQQLLDLKYIKLERNTISSIKEYKVIIEKLTNGDIDEYEYQGGSLKHVALKIIAQNDLIKAGNSEILFEFNYFGRVPDVITKDKSKIFECGDTDPRKIDEYFSIDDNLIIYILPYPDIDDHEIVVYKFIKAKSGLNDFLIKNHLESLSDIKKIITSR